MKNIDEIISGSLGTGRAEAARGLAGSGASELSAGLGFGGLANQTQGELLRNGQEDFQATADRQAKLGAGIGKLIMAGLGW